MSKKNKQKKYRSGTDSCQICGENHRLHCHHIKGRKVKDWDSEKNRVYICPNCHDKVHAGDIDILGWQMSTGGRILIWT